ncbi:MAG: putative DNA-binding domain-containing protein, partial [Verrucomicrobia bacterium]|nr:putative DNA-binding domain-containing protein [Verrucomicrobiota bacterium]
GTDSLPAWQRMEIYSQSYWRRLFGVLHEEFPMLYRLFGQEGFDRLLAVPYIVRYPPASWSLSRLATHFTKWVDAEYQGDDNVLVQACADLDWACREIFVAQEHPRPDLSNGEALLAQKIALQPFVKLLELPGHYLHFRKALLEHPPEYWHEADFPKLEKGRLFYFVLYRGGSCALEWQELSHEAYLLLRAIEEGYTIDEACDRVTLDGIEEQVAFWLQEWLIRNWLHFQL